MPITIENILSPLPTELTDEQFTTLASSPHVTIERIVSPAGAGAQSIWYDQERAEWVMVLAGGAGLQFEGEAEPRVLAAGDHVTIPAHVRHRVAWTHPTEPTVWLAVHY
jgi:cupin 2 domain-containing protein